MFLTQRCLCLIPLASALSTLEYRRTVPPRFDVFAEQAVGDWQSRQSSGNSTTVEEVMRSCGGAVQGIRESSKQKYLNRADDGFIYWDCGSYSVGPTKLEDESYDILTCIQVSKGYRILVEYGRSNTSSFMDWDVLSKQGVVANHRWNAGVKTYKRAESPSPNHQTESPSPNHQTSTQCRLPSTSQLWNMQRVKWEQACFGDDEASFVVKVDSSFKATTTALIDPDDGSLCHTLDVRSESASWTVERMYSSERELIRTRFTRSVFE